MMRCGHRLLALALVAAVAGGCERDNGVQATLDDARIKLRSVAPGGGLSRPELRATTFREVAQSLRQVTTSERATPGQVASAHLMLASIESGLAAPKASEVTAQLNVASGLAGQIRSVAIERGAASSTATVLASYDPTPEIAEIDRAITDTQAELAMMREDLSAVQERIESLRSQATGEMEEARGLRAAEADMRNEALGLDDIEAAELIADAARLGRQADAHEVAAANLEAEAEMLEPEAAQLELRIEGLVAQAAALNKSREGVGMRAQARRARAQEARERVVSKPPEKEGYEFQLDQLVTELIDLSRKITTTATEAAEAYERSASSAARAAQHARKAGRAAAGKARYRAASVQLALAEHLLDTADLLAGLSDARPALSSARTLAASAERLRGEGLTHLEAALEDFRSAQGDLESAGADEGLAAAMTETTGAIEKRLRDAGGRAPADAGGELEIEEPGGELDEPGEDAGGIGGA